MGGLGGCGWPGADCALTQTYLGPGTYGCREIGYGKKNVKEVSTGRAQAQTAIRLPHQPATGEKRLQVRSPGRAAPPPGEASCPPRPGGPHPLRTTLISLGPFRVDIPKFKVFTFSLFFSF